GEAFMKNMKWWGWGSEQFEFPLTNKPALWPFILRKSGLPADASRIPPVAEKDIVLPPQRSDADFERTVRARFKDDQIRTDSHDRLVHAYGKSFPDLFRIRRGEVKRCPDLVLYPDNHDEVEFLVREAARRQVRLIPFGGGTNIVGGVEN